MKNNNKGIYLSISAIVIITGFIYCNKSNNDVPSNQSIKISSTTFDFIGEAHNKGLDYVYSQTFENKSNTKIIDVLNATDKYVFEESPLTKGSKDNRIELFTSENLALLKASVASKSIILNRTELQKKLSPAQFSIIEKLDLIFLLPTYEERQQKIKDLKNEVIINLNDNEIVYILCTLSLAEYSMSYWNSEKGKQWKDRITQLYATGKTNIQIKTNGINKNQNIRANKIDWRNVAVADVAAFIYGFPAGINVGALIGGVTTGVATGGIGAGLGAVLGGLVGGTASGLASAISASAVVLATEFIVDMFE
jgi:hypothetical protein